MNKLKKTLALLLSLVMVLSLAPVAAIAAEDDFSVDMTLGTGNSNDGYSKSGNDLIVYYDNPGSILNVEIAVNANQPAAMHLAPAGYGGFTYPPTSLGGSSTVNGQVVLTKSAILTCSIWAFGQIGYAKYDLKRAGDETVYGTVTVRVGKPTVTFDPNGGDLAGASTTSVYAGETVAAPTVSRTGYTLTGWREIVTVDNTTSVSDSDFDFATPIISDITLQAQWTATEATSISLNKDSVNLNPGQSETLIATVEPEGATVDSWTSSDESVATVQNGVVTAVASGSAIITAKSGSQTATCTVAVTAAAVAEGYSADGDTYIGAYSTLKDALAADGVNYIKLVGTVTEGLSVNQKDITLDLNGHTLNMPNNDDGYIVVAASKSLTIKDSSETGTGAIHSSTKDGVFLVIMNGTVVLEGGKIHYQPTKDSDMVFSGFGALTIQIDGGEIDTTAAIAGGDLETTIRISGGKINGKGFGGWASATGYDANYTINGGSFKGMDIDPSNKTISGIEIAEGYEIVSDEDNGEGWYKVQQHTSHTADFDDVTPTWLWKVVNGEWSVNSIYVGTCSCGQPVVEILDASYEKTETDQEIIYTATDSRGNTDTRTYVKTFQVEYTDDPSQTSSSYLYGAVCKLTTNGATLYDWYVQEEEKEPILRAKGTATFYFPVTANVTVTKQVSTATTAQVPSKATVAAEGGAGQMTYKFVWSIPEGSKVQSAMIYRCKDNDEAITTAAELMAAGSKLRSYDTKLFVRNGEFTYTALNLSSGSKQAIMFRLTYILNDATYTMDTDLTHISIQ